MKEYKSIQKENPQKREATKRMTSHQVKSNVTDNYKNVLASKPKEKQSI